MGYSDRSYYGSNDGKLVCQFLNESLEQIYGTLHYLYDIFRDVNSGVIRIVSRGVGRGLGIDVVGKVLLHAVT